MNKNQIINQFLSNKNQLGKFKSYCLKELKNHRQDLKDVFQDCLIALWEIEEEKVIQQYQDSTLNNLFTGIIHRKIIENWRKNKKHKTCDYLEESHEEIAEEKESDKEQEQKRIKVQKKIYSMFTGSTSTNATEFYEKNIWDLYLNSGRNACEVERLTGIPRASVTKTIKEIEKKLKDKFNSYYGNND